MCCYTALLVLIFFCPIHFLLVVFGLYQFFCGGGVLCMSMIRKKHVKSQITYFAPYGSLINEVTRKR